MARDVALHGFRRIEKALARLPKRTATELQGTLVRQLIETKKEITRSSVMSPRAKRALGARKGIIRILPNRIVRPRRIRDVKAEIYTTWRGGRLPKAEAAARAIESEVGKTHYTPRRKRGLLVPAGILRSKTGAIKRRGGKRLNPAAMPRTRWVRTGRGAVLLVQDTTIKRRGRKLGGFKGARSNIVGILLQKVRITARLDFFRTWARLARRRTGQYAKLLDKLVRTF